MAILDGLETGVVFPQYEIGNDPVVIKDYIQVVEGLGYGHVMTYEHILGANADSSLVSSSYMHRHTFHEPFVLFGFLAGVTNKIKLMTGIVILPQRQTALVAKQAAQVDVLSNGRFRLGIGLGSNLFEYEAMGENFHNRGRRVEEQVDVMRKLWTNEVITYSGKWHKITDAGINPLPVQRPIPIWFGGMADPVLRRIARLGNGWLPNGKPDEKMELFVRQLEKYTQKEGRNLSDITIDARVSIVGKTSQEIESEILSWKSLGASVISINTLDSNLKLPSDHINVLTKFMEDFKK